jgi:hypothetical protein
LITWEANARTSSCGAPVAHGYCSFIAGASQLNFAYEVAQAVFTYKSKSRFKRAELGAKAKSGIPTLASGPRCAAASKYAGAPTCTYREPQASGQFDADMAARAEEKRRRDTSLPSGAAWTWPSIRVIMHGARANLGPAMDLGVWLRGLGLERYEAAFRENEIDDAVLRSLTAEDLKDLGVSIVGHRRKLLDAIAGLRADASLKAPPPEDVPPIGRSAKDTAERRQLTVIFCDLVGSTALSARLDPEDMREIIGAYHSCCAEQITKSGGFVAKFIGDGVLAYFGYPQAHEDDAERAVRAALALIGAVPKLPTRDDAVLQVRIGISTGLVVVGDLIGTARLGSWSAAMPGVVGSTSS